MKTEEARALMVATVNEVFADHPTFDSLPVGEGNIPEDKLVLVKYPELEGNYIEALYRACQYGVKPVGSFKAKVGDVTSFYLIKG